MNLKEHIRKNKIDLEHKAPRDIWDKIEENLTPSSKVSRALPRLYKVITTAAAIAAITLITTQYLHIKSTNQEIVALKETMTSLLQDQSVGQRIKAVTLSEQVTDSNKEIAEVLLHTMVNDPSKNVRLAAIDALNEFTNEEIVRVEILNHLRQSEDTYTQIKLINLLSSVKEKKALSTLDKIIEDQTKNILVKEKAKAGKQLIIQT